MAIYDMYDVVVFYIKDIIGLKMLDDKHIVFDIFKQGESNFVINSLFGEDTFEKLLKFKILIDYKMFQNEWYGEFRQILEVNLLQQIFQ